MFLRRFIKQILLLSLLWGLIQPAYALDNLLELHDIINDNTLNALNVQHEIGFQLPPDAMQISTTDYIIIDLQNFSNVTVPTNIN